MNARQFFDKVVLMREWQKKYFKSHSQSALQQSMRLEKEIDDEIKRVQDIVGLQQPQQGELFTK